LITLWYALPILLIPLGSRFVYEFRPDGVAAVAMISAVWLALKPFGSSTLPGTIPLQRSVLVGLCGAGAALAKPHASPAGVVFLVLAFALALIHARLNVRIATRGPRPNSDSAAIPQKPCKLDLNQSLRSLALGWLAAMLACVPHAYFNGRNIASGILDNMTGEKLETWHKQGAELSGTLYYFTGEGGREYLGLAPLAIVALVCLALFFALRTRAHRHAFEILGLMAASLLAYALVIATPFKHPVFDLPFYVAFAALGIRSMAAIREMLTLHLGRTPFPLLPLVVATLALLVARQPPRVADWHRDLSTQRRRIFDQTAQAIADALPAHDGVCLVAMSGTINATNLQFCCLQFGLSARFPMVVHLARLDQLEQVMRTSRVVVLTDPASSLVAQHFPITGLIESLRLRLDGDPGFRLYVSIETAQPGKPILIYQRTQPRRAKTDPPMPASPSITTPASPPRPSAPTPESPPAP
jgi:hypothetical protein